jgi:hypothetical protein
LRDKLGSEYYRQYRKEWELKHRYGMSHAEYSQRIADQGGRCAICGVVTQKLVVDHNHQTSEVRGLLCVSCNGLLGLANDSPRVLAAAIEYLYVFDGKDATG